MNYLKPEGRLRNSQLNEDCCNDPNLWHSYDNISTEMEVSELLAGFVRALQPELVVETGSAFGYTSYELGKALQNNGHGRLVTIEMNKNRFRGTRKRCKGLPVECVHGNATDWEPNNNERIGLAFFDSSYESRELEFDHFRPFMSLFTVVAWHDTGVEPATKDYVEALARAGLVQPLFLPTPRGICFARVLE